MGLRQRGRRHGAARVGSRRPVGNRGPGRLVRRPRDRGCDGARRHRDAGDRRRRRVDDGRRRGADDAEVVDPALEGRGRAAGVADERAHGGDRHGVVEGRGARPVRPVARVAQGELVALALDAQVGGRAAVDGRVVLARRDAGRDRGGEESRRVAVVVHLEPQQVVRVLLDDDPLELVRRAHGAVELDLDLEIGVRHALDEPGGAVRERPQVVRGRGRQRDDGVRAVHRERRVAHGIDEAPDPRVQRRRVELVGPERLRRRGEGRAAQRKHREQCERQEDPCERASPHASSFRVRDELSRRRQAPLVKRTTAPARAHSPDV